MRRISLSTADEVYWTAERERDRLKQSRSQYYNAAMIRYIARHGGDATHDLVTDEIGDDPEDSSAARRLKR
jgi:hypothetical protein